MRDGRDGPGAGGDRASTNGKAIAKLLIAIAATREVGMNWRALFTRPEPTAGARTRKASPASGPGKSPRGPTQVPLRTWLTFLFLLAVNYLLMRSFFRGPEESITVPYTVFKEQVIKGNVAAIYTKGETVQGRFRDSVTYPTASDSQLARPGRPAAEPRTGILFVTTIPSFVDPGLEGLLIAHDVVISAEPIQQGGNPVVNLLLGFGPGILLIAFYVWWFRQRGGATGFMGFGQSKARRYDEAKDVRVTFDDVAGIEEAENELVEIVDFLKAPEKYTRLGGTVPKGVLLIGAPGTGKTLLARAVAGEAGVPFFSMSASEFVEMIVGVGAARVRDLFRQARENAPAIIFIDEIDAIGRARGPVAVGGVGEQEQTLQQILTEMDGFTGREGVIVLAATNQPDVLDRALLRPGRFDRRVVVNLPDKTGREAILKVHTRKVPLAPDVNLVGLAAATPGFSGADIRNLVNEAALLAARRGESEVRAKDFLDALEKSVLGPERPLVLSREDRERIAYHEGGHTILGLVVPGADPVHRVSIVPRGQALGVTYQRPDSDRYNFPEAYLRARIVGMLGGRAAEEVVYGTRTTGAESDIEQATNLTRMMVTRWGMSDALGLVQLAPRSNPYVGEGTGFTGQKPFSDATARLIDAEVQRIIGECYGEAKQLLNEHRRTLDALAAALLEHETLDEQQILDVTGLPPAPALETGRVAVAGQGASSAPSSG